MPRPTSDHPTALHSPPPTSPVRRRLRVALAAALLGLLATATHAQPFDTWLQLAGRPSHGYVEIAHHTALNPTGAFTFEAWVNVRDANGGDCSTIAGKNWKKAWWIGICGNTLRSYIKGYLGLGGTGDARSAGTLPLGVWTHVAVVFDGSSRKHYVNGELVGSFVETGPLTTSTDPLRIGSDVQWQNSPQGGIDEARLWRVARTVDQLRAGLGRRITGSQTGLVGVWSLDQNGLATVGPHHGTVKGAGVVFASFGQGSGCTVGDPATLCLKDRFALTLRRRVIGGPGSPPDGGGLVATQSESSGVFSFFSPDNYEVMAKIVDGCTYNNRYWLFTAAMTSVYYRLEVFDAVRGEQRIYFNYGGGPAPAVNDVDAFDTCP